MEVNSTTILDLLPSGLTVSTATLSNALALSFLTVDSVFMRLRGLWEARVLDCGSSSGGITSINGSTSSSQEIVSGNNELSVSTAGNTTTLMNLLIGSTSPTDYGLVSYGYDSAVSQGYSTAEDTFLGYYTGHINSSGAFHTAVGGYSGADSAGSGNTGVGAEAVYGGAGSYNTGIGTYALSGNGNAIGSGNI